MRRPLTELQVEALRRLAYSLLPGMHLTVAGGFAIDPYQANDVDLWVLGDPMLVRAAALLDKQHIDYIVPELPSNPDVPFTESVANDEAREHATLKVHTPLRDIHIVGTEIATVPELLASFDISTHRWAVTEGGARVAGIGATFTWEDGKVLAYRFPKSTDARVRKLEKRYGITLHPYQEPGKKERGPKGKAA